MAPLLDTLRGPAYTTANGSNRLDVALTTAALVGNRVRHDSSRLCRPCARRDDDCTDLARGGVLCAGSPGDPALLSHWVDRADTSQRLHPGERGRRRLRSCERSPGE